MRSPAESLPRSAPISTLLAWRTPDVGIAYAMYQRAMEAGMGQDLKIQNEMIFEHAHLKDWVRLNRS